MVAASMKSMPIACYILQSSDASPGSRKSYHRKRNMYFMID